MQEIEIKAVLQNKANAVLALETLGCTFNTPIRQEDEVYVENVGNLETFNATKVFLRIRVIDAKRVIFTAKQRYNLALVAKEHETTVESADEIREMLAMMNYKKQLEIKKLRTKTEYKGDEICIDEVDGLGSYIEMERLSRDGNPAIIQEELWRLFDSIGIARTDRIDKGYDILLMERKSVPAHAPPGQLTKSRGRRNA